ncbi:MAG: S-layer homology domain-containing protein, partial [Acidimicrobiia bacterium]|nr:S-layer homology domain-containing protein [Acidimicrobiia bacterium]
MRRPHFYRVLPVFLLTALIAIGAASVPVGAVGGFGDVEGSEFYADAVQWMVDEDLTTGTSPGCFSPDRQMTRGELATFFWRYAGEPQGGSHPFVDVASSDFFADAVGWMSSEGITGGTSPTTFSPDRIVTRGEVAVFMWRYEGEPRSALSPFLDVPSTAFYAEAVGWMTSEGITGGTSPTTFSPLRELTRAEFATFFYRWAGSPSVQDSGGGTCIATGERAGAPPPPTTFAPPASALFFEDFSGNDSMSRFAFDIDHRDEVIVAREQWEGDHQIIGPNDMCGPPEDKRIVTRGERSEDFNDEWIYRCAPGGDPAKAHVMTSIGDTSGYSIGAFSPTQTFTDVREVRWDVNITDLG